MDELWIKKSHLVKLLNLKHVKTTSEKRSYKLMYQQTQLN
jgi:hypothetical protein